jgi:hypothetical protein
MIEEPERFRIDGLSANGHAPHIFTDDQGGLFG